LVAGQDLNLRPLGYEESDMCLRRLGRSLACGPTSAAVRPVVACGGVRFPASACLVTSRLQIGLQKRSLTCRFRRSSRR